IFSFKIAGEGWFSTKFDEPCLEDGSPIAEGDEITFEWDYDEDYEKQKNCDLDTVVLESEGNEIPEEEEKPKRGRGRPRGSTNRKGKTGGRKSSSRSSSRSSSGRKSSSSRTSSKSSGSSSGGSERGDEYWDEKNLRVAHGFCRDSAVNMMRVFVSAGGELNLGKVKGKQLGIFKELVEALTKELLRQNNDINYIKSLLDQDANDVEDSDDNDE
ncbi:MAG: hypothetical protein PVI03_07175, partial [Candidatus Thorarchaeota archaeon]